MDEQLELQRKINDIASSQIPSLAWDCTVPIVIAHEGSVHHFGTGTLFRISDYFFLITAGHVIKQACANGKTVGIGGSEDGKFIALIGDTLVSAASQYGTSADPLDIGVHRLARTAVDRLQNKQFLILDNIDFDDQSPTAVFCIFGYPGIWSLPSSTADEAVRYKALQLTTYRYDRDTSTLDEYQEGLHLLLDARLDQITNHDATPVDFNDRHDQPIPFPRGLAGISGCSVWRIGDLKTPFDRWKTVKPHLVAVQTGVYHNKSVIKATRWVAVSTLIHGAFPELRPAMELWRVR